MTYTLQLSEDDQALTVRKSGDRKPVQVRGGPGYVVRHDPLDHLHGFLDSLDPATVSALMTYVPVTLNPKNTRQAPTFKACDWLMSKNP